MYKFAQSIPVTRFITAGNNFMLHFARISEAHAYHIVTTNHFAVLELFLKSQTMTYLTTYIKQNENNVYFGYDLILFSQ